ncbi:hypothetical protein AB4Z55_25240 [Gordonia sp. ABKF26]|uniref:hypothetical protein n=1 Tax=Gordonia sp. ABKF26 TaxID=3238687 RepID=UPI0034E3C4DE
MGERDDRDLMTLADQVRDELEDEVAHPTWTHPIGHDHDPPSPDFGIVDTHGVLAQPAA